MYTAFYEHLDNDASNTADKTRQRKVDTVCDSIIKALRDINCDK